MTRREVEDKNRRNKMKKGWVEIRWDKKKEIDLRRDKTKKRAEMRGDNMRQKKWDKMR